MAANAVVRARIDEAIKDEATVVLASMGLTVSDAFRLMLTRVAREKALPFEPLIPNAVTIAAMKEARAGNLPSVVCNASRLLPDARESQCLVLDVMCWRQWHREVGIPQSHQQLGVIADSKQTDGVVSP